MQVESMFVSDPQLPPGTGFTAHGSAYTQHRFSDGTRAFIARSFAHSLEEAHFLRVEDERGTRPLSLADFNDPLLHSAVFHLRASGVLSIRWFDGRELARMPDDL